MPAPQQIIELVDRFERNFESYKSGSYNETQTRREFLDPFFEALGWDVSNKQGYAEAYKDVVHEYSQKTADSTEAPDYLFRIGGTRKFFVEAKKPSVKLADDISPAYQLRRYAWTAKLPLSILTDFEEFAVYDCRIKPNKNDKPSTARIHYYTYKDYIDKWDEIESVFSKDAILKGSFDKFAETNKGKRGTAEVDDAFLKEIETWRESLAKNIAIRNSKLSNRELNYSVQKIIDRIIFLRICEDRGIEEYGQLMNLLNGTNVYKRLLQIFTRADEKYNSGLFHFEQEKDRPESPDELTPKINIDDKTLKEIIKTLYYPDSPYEFSVLPADILGHVYEQFLGKVIRLTPSHQAKVEEKPEVKKAGGVYYTPTYIVDYIVKNTLGKLLTDDKTPKHVGKIKIMDPACGSGSFLIVAYQYLLDWHLKYYINNEPGKLSQTKNPPVYLASNGEWKLTTAERKRILLNNIYGVDIDPQAVEVTKLSLLLKVLEGETEETLTSQFKFFRERALPDLGSNIKCGNSLIGPDFYSDNLFVGTGHVPSGQIDDEERMRINVFDWHKEFSDVFKNTTRHSEQSEESGFDIVIGNPPYGAELSSVERNYFINKINIGTTDTAAIFIYIQLNLLNKRGYGSFIIPKPFIYASNWKLIREKIYLHISDLVDVSKVWRNVKLEQVIYIIRKDQLFSNYNSWVRNKHTIMNAGLISKELYNKFGFLLSGVTEKEIQLAEKILTKSQPLSNLVINTRGAMLQKFVVKTKEEYKVLGGKQIHRYSYTQDIKGFISPKNINDSKAFVKENSILVQNIVAHIMNPYDHIQIIATILDKSKTIILDTINQLENKTNLPTKFILGVINSKLFSWYAYRFVFAKAIRTMHFDGPVTSKLPFPSIFNGNIVNKIDYHVDTILKYNKLIGSKSFPQEKEVIQRQIDAVDKEIDRLVYELYGLTEEEIKIVESP